MKHTLLSLAVVIPMVALAQPQFNRSDLFSPGTSYQKFSIPADSVLTETTGADVVWNCSASSSEEQNETIEPFSTQGPYQSFTGAGWVIGNQMGGDSLYRYFTSSDTSYGLNGFYHFSFDGFPPPPGSNGPMVYTPALDILRFPAAMGSTFTQAISGQKNQDPDTIMRYGTQTVTVDGYGTLTTPAGTFQDVLRVYTFQEMNDITMGGMYVRGFNVESWTWISAATKGVPLLHKEITYDRDAFGMQSVAWYTDPGDVGMENTYLRSFALYPNPIQENFTLSGTAEPGELVVDLYSLTGQKVQQLYKANSNGQQFHLQLSVQHVSPGFYLVRVSNGSKQEAYPVMVN